MREIKTKSEFIKDMEKRIAIRKMMFEFVENVYFPMMCLKFDGKVYNKRFINALNDEAKKMNSLMYVKEREYDHIEIQCRVNQYNYNDYESIYLKCNLDNDGRINYDNTINDKVGQAWIENAKKTIDDYQSSIDNYDEYMKVFVELADALEKYNKLPHTFRGHLDTSWMRIY